MQRDVKTLCSYCGVGCGLIATTDGAKVLRVRGDTHHPANFGRVCPKGATLSQTVNEPPSAPEHFGERRVSHRWRRLPRVAERCAFGIRPPLRVPRYGLLCKFFGIA